MTDVYVIHPDEDEVSKINHILSGRDLGIRCFIECESPVLTLAKHPPDVVLMPLNLVQDQNQAFYEMLQSTVKECPVILLVNKTEVTSAIQMVGDKKVYDYFLLHPIVDPARLHVIVDKALTQSAVQLNLESLKQRLSALPANMPGALEKHSNNLSSDINKVLDSFKERMKGDEFTQIVKLLDGAAFEEKFQEFKKIELSNVLETSKKTIREDLMTKLENFTANIKSQLTASPDVDSLHEMRKQLSGGFFFDCTELISEKLPEPSKNLLAKSSVASKRVVDGIRGKIKRILYIEDTDFPLQDVSAIARELGYEIQIVQSSRKFLHLLSSQQFDCLLIGYNLGDMTGIEMTRRIREGLGLNNVPVVLLSPKVTSEIKQKSEDVGIDEIVELPFHPSVFRSRIISILSESVAGVH